MARSASSERLSRILALVPWVLSQREAVTVEAVCKRFNISRLQLQQDIDLLMVCGTPPFQPGDYIDAWIDNEVVTIRMADYLAKPLRLTRWEAVTLLAGGRALLQLPEFEQPEALSSAIAKIASTVTLGEDQAATLLAERIAIELESSPEEVIVALRDAIERTETINIAYYSFGRDELTTRDFDPWLVFGSSPWYLVGFDHKSGERRTLRVDRIRSIEMTGRSFDRPEEFDPIREANAPLYHPGTQDTEVVFEVAPAQRWVAEVTPIDGVKELADGWLQISLHAGSLAWLARLGLQLGTDMRIIEPKSLGQEVRKLASQTLTLYDPK